MLCALELWENWFVLPVRTNIVSNFETTEPVWIKQKLDPEKLHESGFLVSFNRTYRYEDFVCFIYVEIQIWMELIETKK